MGLLRDLSDDSADNRLADLSMVETVGVAFVQLMSLAPGPGGASGHARTLLGDVRRGRWSTELRPRQSGSGGW
jgi:hypothetical protein